MQSSKNRWVTSALMLGPFMLGLAFVGFAAGCGNPTNAPTIEAVKQADDNRRAAIDNDPKLSAAEKEKMKQMMGLAPGGRQGTVGGGPGTPPQGR